MNVRRIRKLLKVPFPEVPAGQTKRGAITTQKVHTYALSKVRVIDGCVTLPQLAAERGIQAQLARLWIKTAGVKKPAARWVWKEDSLGLKRAREALGLRG